MYNCPKCQTLLIRQHDRGGVFWTCDRCGGRAMGMGLLRRANDEKFVKKIWMQAVGGGASQGCSCPMCSRDMLQVATESGENSLTVDVCRLCELVWFDAGQYELMPPPSARPHVLGEIDEKKLPPELRETLALARVKQMADKAKAEDPAPDQGWKTVPALFFLPVEMDSSYCERIPWATYLLSLLIAGVSIAAFFNLDSMVDHYGFIPKYAWRDYGLTLLTSFFLHGGIFHLVSNLYFLLVFGRAVENEVGPWRLLLLLFLADQTGNLLQAVGDPRGLLPCIGASGGISGVLTFYALKFPKAELGILFSFRLVFYRWIRFPAWAAFFIWILLQAWGAYRQADGFGDVSSLAHLGGVLVGAVLWWVWRRKGQVPAATPVRGQLPVKIS